MSYVNDKSKNGEKRAKLLKAILMNTPVEERQTETLRAFKTADEKIFKGTLARQMGEFTDKKTLQVLHGTMADTKETGYVRMSSAIGLAVRGDSSVKKFALDSILTNTNWPSGATEVLSRLKAKDTLPELEKGKKSSKDNAIKNMCSVAILGSERKFGKRGW